jgi:hypothetical protein
MELILIGGAVVAVLVGGWVSRGLFSDRNRARRTLRRTRRVSIAEARDGKVARLTGRLRFVNTPLSAPISGRHCAWYNATVEQQRPRGSSHSIERFSSDILATRWVSLCEESRSSGSMIIADDTGTALVELDYPMVLANMETQVLLEATPALEKFLARREVPEMGRILGKTLRTKEAALVEGDEVAVCGLCRWEPDPSPHAGSGYRDWPLRLRVVAPHNGRVLVIDESAAGADHFTDGV